MGNKFHKEEPFMSGIVAYSRFWTLLLILDFFFFFNGGCDNGDFPFDLVLDTDSLDVVLRNDGFILIGLMDEDLNGSPKIV